MATLEEKLTEFAQITERHTITPAVVADLLRDIIDDYIAKDETLSQSVQDSISSLSTSLDSTLQQINESVTGNSENISALQTQLDEILNSITATLEEIIGNE